MIVRKTRLQAASILAVVMMASAGLGHAQSAMTVSQITSAANNGTDKSMQLLQTVFGSIASNPLNGGSSSSGSGGMIAQALGPLNASILVIGAIWACYLFLAALIATGAEGEFMGAKRSSIWFTIRNGFGISMMVPITGGYSGAQLIMMWATMMGVGIANLTVGTATSVLASGGSMVASPAAPQVMSLAKSLFEANLCAQAANQALKDVQTQTLVAPSASENFSPGTAMGKIVLMNQNGLSCGGAQVDAAQSTGSTGNAVAADNVMATMAPDTSQITSSLTSAQESALTAMQTTLSTAATAYVAAVTGGSQPSDPQTTINQAAQAYQQSIQSAITSAGNSVSSMSTTLQSNLAQSGWIMLGAWYQSFAIANSAMANSAKATATAIPPTDLNSLPYPDLYNNVMASYNQQLAQDASTSVPAVGSVTSSTGVAAGSGTSSLSNFFSVSTDPQHLLAAIFPGQNLVNEVTSLMSTAGTGGAVNPLIGMKNVGDYILDAGWGTLGLYVTDEAIDGAMSSGAGSVAKQVGNVLSGGTFGSVQAALQKVIGALSPLIIMLLVSLFFFGAMLSVYLPMLPFIIWFGGIISWFAIVCEAIVAAPLWAFTHLDGEGEGMGQRTNHGYVFLLNLMLRPAFMVIGFLLAGAGVVGFGTLLNSMFSIAMANAQFASVTGLVSIIAYIVLYVGLCQTLCQGIFGLITHIPNSVFTWVGTAMHAQLGDATHDKNHTFVGGVMQKGGQGLTQGFGPKKKPAPTGGSGISPDEPGSTY
jgi:conjugal transfer/type IV secretion protein DotA/TraY